MAERDYTVTELGRVRNVDATTVVQKAIVFRPLSRAHRASRRLAQFLRSLSNGLLLRVLNTLADISQYVLFRSNELQPFHCTYCKEFRTEEHYVGVVISASSMVCPARQCVWFTHRLSRPVRECEVKAREIEGPACLAPVQLLCHHEVLQVLVVCQYLTWVFGAFDKVPPLLQCPDDCKHLLVVYLVVAFNQRQ